MQATGGVNLDPVAVRRALREVLEQPFVWRTTAIYAIGELMAPESFSLRSLAWFGLVFGVAYAATHLVQGALGFSSQRAWVVVWSVGWIGISLAMLWRREFPM